MIIAIINSENKEQKLSIYVIFLAGNIEGMLELENSHLAVSNEIIDLGISQWMLNPLVESLLGIMIPA